MDDSSPVRRSAALGLLAAILFSGGIAGCSTFKGTTATSFLRNVRDDPDPNVRYASYEKLASPHCYDSPEQKAEAVQTLIAKLEEGREPIATRAVICRTLGALGDKTAREAIIKAVSDTEPVIRVQACRALGRVGNPEDATLLARVMTVDTLEDCRIAAIDAIGTLKAHDTRILEVLVANMEHVDPAIRLASLNALRKISDKDLGVEPAPWREYVVAQIQANSPGGAPAGPMGRSPLQTASVPLDPAARPASTAAMPSLVPAPQPLVPAPPPLVPAPTSR